MKAQKNFQIIDKFQQKPWTCSVLVKDYEGHYCGGCSMIEVSLEQKPTLKGLVAGDTFGQLFKYQIRVSEDDTLARWTSKPEERISVESLEAAKKILYKNLKTKNKIHKLGKTFKHIKQMIGIVEDTTKSYKTDFYWHDIFSIGLDILNNKEIDFYWIVREGGTTRCNFNDEAYDFYKNKSGREPGNRFYHVTEKGIYLLD